MYVVWWLCHDDLMILCYVGIGLYIYEWMNKYAEDDDDGWGWGWEPLGFGRAYYQGVRMEIEFRVLWFGNWGQKSI